MATAPRADDAGAQAPLDPRAARFIDLDALGCGSLTIALMRALRAAAPGERVEVRAKDLGAPADIPAWCGLTGHALLAGAYGPDGARYLIERRSGGRS